MILYDYPKSTAAYRVRITMALKGLDYERREVGLIKDGGEQHQPDFRALNPQGRVPALVLEDGRVITQSLSILSYLDALEPTPALLPSDPVLAAQVSAFALTVACDIHPLNNLSVLQYLKRELHVTDQQKLDWYHHWVREGFSALERQLQDTAGDFCFGGQLSLADVCLIPQVFNANRFQCDMTPYPVITHINAHCLALAAFSDTAP